MLIEEQIRQLLLTGQSPKSVIEKGFKKSTVYKVYDSVKQFTNPVNLPKWTIEAIAFNNNGRYMPGNTAQINFYFKNNSDRDLYIVNLGVQPEWMIKQNQWIAQPLKELLKAGQRKFLSLSFGVPNNLPLGEYELYFGVEGQYLPVHNFEDTALTTQWSDPKIINVKKPSTGVSIFLSHGVQDSYLVQQLANSLDNNGINVLLPEEEVRVGTNIQQTIANMINSCNVFVALVTESSAGSPQVNLEIQHAKNMNKPLILLREQSVPVTLDYPWIVFSKEEHIDKILQTIMSSIQNLPRNAGVDSGIAALLGLALIGIVIGALASRE
jgi:hypothetical protein